MAATILAGWAVGNATNADGQDAIWPIMDAIISMSIALAWVENPTFWKAKIFILFIAQCVCHVAYHVALAFDARIGYCYTAALNALFLCQLWVVSSDGIERGRDYMRDWFADFHGRDRAYAFRASFREAE